MTHTENNKSLANDASFCSAKVKIVNQRGLHARASARFVKLACHYDAKIMVSKEKQEVLGTSIMGLLLLTAAKGDTVTITAEGNKAREALEALKNLIENKFEEDN